jgi:hypothetical protein
LVLSLSISLLRTEFCGFCILFGFIAHPSFLNISTVSSSNFDTFPLKMIIISSTYDSTKHLSGIFNLSSDYCSVTCAVMGLFLYPCGNLLN